MWFDKQIRAFMSSGLKETLSCNHDSFKWMTGMSGEFILPLTDVIHLMLI